MIAAIILILAGGALTVLFWLSGGSDAVLFVILGVLMMGVGFTIQLGRNRHTSYILTVTGILSLVISVGRVASYGPMENLAIAFFVLAVVLLFRGYQYHRAS